MDEDLKKEILKEKISFLKEDELNKVANKNFSEEEIAKEVETKYEEIEEKIKIAAEEGKKIIENIKKVTTTDDDVMKKIQKEINKEKNLTLNNPTEETLNEKKETEIGEQEIINTKKPKNKNKLKKDIVAKIAGLTAAIVVLAIIGPAHTSNKSNKKTSFDTPEILDSENNNEDIVIISNSGIPVEETEKNIIEDLEYLDDEERIPVEIIETEDKKEKGMKNIPTDRIPEFIESVSKQTNQAPNDLFERYMSGTSVAEAQTSTNTEVKVTPQKDVLRQAIIDSGAMQTSANDEYSAIMNQGQGIKPENLEYWYDQGNALEFFKNSATGLYEVIEPQKDGSKKILGWWTFDAVERYIESIAKNTDADFYDLFEKQTGENYLEELDSLNMKGASR